MTDNTDSYLLGLRDKINSGTYDIEELLNDLNSHLDNKTLAGLPLADYEMLEDMLNKIQDRLKVDRGTLGPAKANSLDSFIRNLKARANAYSERRISDSETVRAEADTLKIKYDELTEDIESLHRQAVELLYVSGEVITPGARNYDFAADERLTPSKGTHVPVPDLKIDKIYLTEEDVRYFIHNRADLMTARSNTEKRAEAATKFTSVFQRLQILITERNKIKNSLLEANERMEKMALGGFTEGYDADVVVTEARLPRMKDENAEIKKIHDELLADFESVMGSVHTFEDLMKLYLDESKDLLKDLKRLNRTGKDKNSFDNMVKRARAIAGSNPEAKAILKDIEYIRNAYFDTRHIVDQVIKFKEKGIERLRADITTTRADLHKYDQERLAKEEEIIKTKYILGLVDARELERFTKRTGRPTSLGADAERDRDRIKEGNDALKMNYEAVLADAEIRLTELTTKVNNLRTSLTSREQAIRNIEEGVLTGSYEAMIKNNPNINIGTKRIEELRSGYSREADISEVLNPETMGHTLDEEAPKPKKKSSKGKGKGKPKDGEPEKGDDEPSKDSEPEKGDDEPSKDSEPEKGDDGELPTLPKEEDEDLGVPELPKDDSLDSKDPSKDKSEKGKKKGERKKPKIIGKLPKAALVFLAAAGLLTGGILVGSTLFAPGAIQLVAAGFLADKAISSMGQKK